MAKNSNMAPREFNGLYLHGYVKNRARRISEGANGEERQLVTYQIIANDKEYLVKEWEPKSYFEIGEIVDIPVFVKPFLKKNGDAGIDFCTVAEMLNLHGEKF